MKNNNAITINVNDDLRAMIDKLAQHYQRKIADYIRVILTPVLIEQYAKMQRATHTENAQPLTIATFKKLLLFFFINLTNF